MSIIESIMPFQLNKVLIAGMISHALETDPEESCGLLIGRDMAERMVRMENVHPQPSRRYEMSPVEVMRAEADAEDSGQRIVAIYHSHTFTQAYPSQTDADNAVQSGWTDPVYVLVSLVEKWRPVVRAFRIAEDGSISELPITTDGTDYIEVG